MWSEYSLEVVDAVARTGSFSAAAQELHRVPSAVSYTVRQLEQWLAVPLFERRHRDVELTPAGALFIKDARVVIKNARHPPPLSAGGQRVARPAEYCGGHHRQTAAQPPTGAGFLPSFPDVELMLQPEVFNGVWDALVDGRADMAIGATRAVPVGGGFAFRDMGYMNWLCVVSPQHPLAQLTGPLNDELLRPYPSLCLEDTSRNLPKRVTWTLDNQRRLVVPDWTSALDCLCAGLCVGMMPAHRAPPRVQRGELKALQLQQPFPASPCCLTWQQDKPSPAMSWLLAYLGDGETLNQEWLSEAEPEAVQASGAGISGGSR